MILARHGEEDYVFSLLTGYWDAPAGFQVQEGLTYNPYFPGGNIGMPQQLFQDSVEYDDGNTSYMCTCVHVLVLNPHTFYACDSSYDCLILSPSKAHLQLLVKWLKMSQHS